MRTVAAFAIIGLATLAIVAAAAEKKPQEAKAAADYFRLRVGDSWTYRNTEEGGYTFKVLSEEPQTGGPSRFTVEVSSGVKIINVFSKTEGWVLLHAEQYPEHEGMEAKYEPPRRYLANPLSVGQKWQWTGLDPARVEVRESNRVVGTESVTVPAGTFRAMKVVTEISGTAEKTRTSWYADGVGLVKSVTEAGKIKYGSDLTDYSFKEGRAPSRP